ncbi:tRNA lysidine(34) synthetase TilS [Endozoicomonas sp. SM1973]|uniref:tRNA(Ile)-lysidine synthase n=1 Tax=Spartinivicinus marinus TaxID=2994442 RepID=A0A853I7Y6_9GAMM|nr:tRNA lysidine(34) synthetase TilS [Spartinivicinus marinus]MCX4025436.1 tRNA lysidine(34) synthetase TilS [Spartinivicinus marinus]NYZ65335.1 tRNA lysidine(34) synthetase TilS [Spartinivicinus marinus]
MDLPQLYCQKLERLLADYSPTRLVVAFSGGLDSTVLLSLTCRFAAQYQLPLVALHVNHGLSPNAKQWEKHCQRLATQLGCDFVVRQVEVRSTGNGIEEAARAERYQAFEVFLEATDVLLLGHHLQDQLETLLFRFCRGSGVSGLAGMPSSRMIGKARLFRPLLKYTKTDLLHYAQQHQLIWVEDESNETLDFSRNFLRHEILPKLECHWPNLYRQLIGTQGHCQDAASILEDMAQLDYQTTQVSPPAHWRQGLSILPLSCQHLLKLPSPRRHNLIRYWLKFVDINITRPLLLEIENSLLMAAEDAMPTIVVGSGKGALKRFQDCLFFLPDSLTRWLPISQQVAWDWQQHETIELVGNGQLRCNQVGNEVSTASLKGRPLTMAYREQLSLDKFAVAGRQGRKTLKRWFQEYQVPPWLRERWPLLFVDNELVVIPGLLVNQAFTCDGGEQGLSFQWEL